MYLCLLKITPEHHAVPSHTVLKQSEAFEKLTAQVAVKDGVATFLPR